MKMRPIIEINDISKLYRIGTGEPRYQTFREALINGLSAPFRNFARIRKLTHFDDSTRSTKNGNHENDLIWALRGISFQVQPGEVLGIIGRNGAGKSTLLKVLSRITEPSSGEIIIRGRIASLLEVGTGFHPELTGRENIFLNGAIMGMRKGEISHNLDAIVDFAGLHRFIDTPVKHYSSGMYMRLAFAVAAHLEPEILLIDEVLAVGDAEFQKRCLEKMGEVAKGGRTVLFVSHNMNAISTLCNRCVLLDQGLMLTAGVTNEVVREHLQSGSNKGEWVSQGSSSLTNRYFSPTRFALVDRQLNPLNREARASESIGILIEGVCEAEDSALSVGFAVYAISGELLFWSLHTDMLPHSSPPIHVGLNRMVCWLPTHFLNEGEYRIELHSSLHFVAWLSQPGVNAPAVSLSVRGGLSDSPFWMMARPGFMAPLLQFDTVMP